MKKVLVLLVVLCLSGCDDWSKKRIITLETQVVQLEAKIVILEVEKERAIVLIASTMRQAQSYYQALEMIKGKLQDGLEKMQPEVNEFLQKSRRR